MGDSERETGRDESTTEREANNHQPAKRATPTTNRRRVLRALGGTSALAAFAGSSAARREGGASATDGRTPEEARERARQDGQIDPVWGFPALSDDEEPPVSPQHQVTLEIRPRDAPVPEFVFEPTGLYVESGDTVQFNYESPHHTVTAYHPDFGYLQRVPDGVPPFSAPALPQGGYWLYTFEQSGVYDIHCAPHEIFGHAMRIVVGSPSGPGADPLADLCAQQGTMEMAETTETTEMAEGEETADEGETTTTTRTTTMAEGEQEGDGQEEGSEEGPSPPRLGAYTVLSDPGLDPDNIVDERRVRWEDLDSESKQVFVRFEGFPPC